jgi:hypothetical protein
VKLKLQNKTSHVAYTVQYITWFLTPKFWRENTDFPLVDFFFDSFTRKYYVSFSTIYCFIFQLRPHVPKFKTPTEEDFENIKLISNEAYA